MSRRALLSPEQRIRLFDIPVDQAEMARQNMTDTAFADIERAEGLAAQVAPAIWSTTASFLRGLRAYSISRSIGHCSTVSLSARFTDASPARARALCSRKEFGWRISLTFCGGLRHGIDRGAVVQHQLRSRLRPLGRTRGRRGSEFSARRLGLNTPFRSFAQQYTTINEPPVNTCVNPRWREP